MSVQIRLQGMFLVIVLLISTMTACGSDATPAAQNGPSAATTNGSLRETPIAQLRPASLQPGQRLRVVASTSLVGNAVQSVGGNHIDLTVLMPPGTDPHAYSATPDDQIALDQADAIFVNGLGLEGSILPTLTAVENPILVSVNEGVTPLEGSHEEEGAEVRADEGDHGAHDPHTWQDVSNVRQWALNIGEALASLDPTNAQTYRSTASEYAAELELLDREVSDALSVISKPNRKLVTDHDDLSYFAHAYGFDVVGSVVPSFSTMASVSARDMAALEQQIADEGVRAIFVGNAVDPKLAEQIARDAGITVVRLYTDSLSPEDGPAPDYASMMRINVAQIVDALR
jgi:ABC-type Zn uptake system ZnuABC Zn-binding protein ZnuA